MATAAAIWSALGEMGDCEGPCGLSGHALYCRTFGVEPGANPREALWRYLMGLEPTQCKRLLRREAFEEQARMVRE